MKAKHGKAFKNKEKGTYHILCTPLFFQSNYQKFDNRTINDYERQARQQGKIKSTSTDH
jgi:hypothetical protein